MLNLLSGTTNLSLSQKSSTNPNGIQNEKINKQTINKPGNNNNYNKWIQNYPHIKTSDINILQHKYVSLTHTNKHFNNTNKL